MTLTCSLIYQREKDKTNICINHNVNDLHAGPYLQGRYLVEFYHLTVNTWDKKINNSHAVT